MAYRKSSLTNTYTTAVTTKQVARKTLFPVFNRANSIIINKGGLTKENARISIKGKKYKLYKFTQKDRNINLLCVEGIIEKQQRRRFNFYTERTLRKLLSKRKIGWLQSIETIDYEIDCS